MTHLTEVEFGQAQDAVDALVRSTKRGTPEKAVAEAVSKEWEAVYSAPQATAQQRQDRKTLIAETAVRLRLIAR